jgi:hypothetical protein
MPTFHPAAAWRIVRTVHTVVWAFFAGSILAIPLLALYDRWTGVAILTGLVVVECVVLAANGMRCPLTDVAARYTDDRRPNFDIYLPAWLAEHNKLIFGSLFAAGLAFTLARWLG